MDLSSTEALLEKQLFELTDIRSAKQFYVDGRMCPKNRCISFCLIMSFSRFNGNQFRIVCEEVPMIDNDSTNILFFF